jgi:hypothetical protein
MSARRERRLIANAAPMMQPGERPELIIGAKVGSVKQAFGKQVALGLATAVLSGGAMYALSSQAAVYVLLTDRQVLFFEQDHYTGGPGKFHFAVPRQYVAITEPQSGFFYKFDFYVQGWHEGLELAVPPLPPSNRRKGAAFAGAFPRLSPIPA